MKKLVYAVLLLAIALFCVTFSFKNTQIIDLSYYDFFHWQGPLAYALIVSFFLGIVVGLLFSMIGRLKTRVRLSHARQEVRRAESEISSLKASASREIVS